jgi:DNA invertase Pin-like site-specific DNA recombinase
MKPAFAYLRVSGKGQVEGDGFPRQLEAVRKYAAANDLKIVKIYREEGVSGKTDWEDRPAFAEMMIELLSDGTHVVVIERLDRVARDLMVQESILADFKRKGLTVLSVNEPDLCSDDPSRVLVRHMMGAFFQYEKSMIVQKTRAARERIRATGNRCEGKKPFGHYEGEWGVLEAMRRMRDQGLALDVIAEKMNSAGIPTRQGRQWHAMTISNILKRKDQPKIIR